MYAFHKLIPLRYNANADDDFYMRFGNTDTTDNPNEFGNSWYVEYNLNNDIVEYNLNDDTIFQSNLENLNLQLNHTSVLVPSPLSPY